MRLNTQSLNIHLQLSRPLWNPCEKLSEKKTISVKRWKGWNLNAARAAPVQHHPPQSKHKPPQNDHCSFVYHQCFMHTTVTEIWQFCLSKYNLEIIREELIKGDLLFVSWTFWSELKTQEQCNLLSLSSSILVLYQLHHHSLHLHHHNHHHPYHGTLIIGHAGVITISGPACESAASWVPANQSDDQGGGGWEGGWVVANQEEDQTAEILPRLMMIELPCRGRGRQDGRKGKRKEGATVTVTGT